MPDSFISLLKRLEKRKLMIIGDMVADVYVEGKVSRISREAPVLILEHDEEFVVPGGASNAVHNAAALGGSVYAVGVVGDDFAGQELISVLKEKGVKANGLIVDKTRPTITKTRVMAGGQATVRQQIVRIDRERKEPLSSETEEVLLSYIVQWIQEMDAVVFSDYGSHTITDKMIRYVIEECNKISIPCIVDSRYNIRTYHGVSLVKQNESEASSAAKIDIVDRDSLLKAGNSILKDLNAMAVLITRGPDGMTLFENGGRVIDIPVTNKSEVYDVTGAGDTVVATMALALAAGAEYETAARLANFAAGIVVRKPGTATTDLLELCHAIGEHNCEIC